MPDARDHARGARLPLRTNRPRKGACIKVEPIRGVAAIATIKQSLADQPRNLCLFTLGINTAFRAGELVSLRICDVADLREGDGLEIKQSKNQKYRRASLNGIACEALRQWLSVHPDLSPAAPLFLSQKGGAISVSYVCQLVKEWCANAGLKGNYGSHTLRKTWGYQQRIIHNAPTALLMRAFGHASEAQTLTYLCIQPEEIRNLYLEMEL
ncbi:MAG: tyrosine-type recombinase/integrase [Alphaproteobacteria bacterium]